MQKTCKYCSEEFTTRKSKQKFCSQSCGSRSRGTISHEDRHKLEKVCLECGLEFLADKLDRKFCSQSCAGSMNGRKFPKRTRVIRFCEFCGEERSGTSTKFCSITCGRKQIRKVYISAWKAGEETGTRGKKFKGVSAHIRTHLFEINNNSCQVCGWSHQNQHTLTIPLEIHHIDGDYLNNRPENLQLVCPNCHSLTKGYKGANAGKGNSEKRIGGGREDYWKGK